MDFDTIINLLLEAFGSDKLIEVDDFLKLCTRFALSLTSAYIVIKLIYVRLYRWNEQVFTYFAFNIITFALCFLLRKVPIELGFALGLFAVFGILRYRTEPIKIRDLTYLFVVIGLAILNAVANRHVSVAELLFINGIIVVSTYVLEMKMGGDRHVWKTIMYDRLDLVHPSKHDELVKDLADRIGIRVHRVDVVHADLLRDVAKLRVECEQEEGANS